MKGFLTSGRPPGVAPEKPQALFHWSLPEVRIVAGYVIFASMWIVASDVLMSRYVSDPQQVGLAQSLKGLNFVITTGVLLYLVLRRSFGGWRHAEHQRQAVIEEARERFRRLSSYIQTLREDDRRRISREIHDELGQLLTGLKMELRLIESGLSKRDDRNLNPWIDKLVESSEIVDMTIRSVQRISAGLRPQVLDDLGLGPALRDEAERFSSRTSIPCVLEIDDYAGNLPDDVSTAAFRIFQESLTNIARHADAQRIDSSLKVNDNELKLAIHDDGKGINPGEIGDPKSLGLIGMIERAGNVGGEVVFRRAAGHGTDVILTIPLQKAGVRADSVQ
ncbi:MAG: sensor histidine kinase [Verrucomicrobiota bacterium]